MRRLCDFGLSINHLHERPMQRVGTFEYMAPEVILFEGKQGTYSRCMSIPEADITPKVDVWGLGVLAYEALVGETPFLGSSMCGHTCSLQKQGSSLPLHAQGAILLVPAAA